MKIQYIAIIFVIIVLPISMVMSSYISSQIDTITLQTEYDTNLNIATYDAVIAFQKNTVNNRYSSVSDSKIRDIEASISTFYNSISNNKYLSKEEIQVYTPALVYTLYDGYYIYSKYDNVYPENGGKVYTNVNETNTNYGLKPYIYYSCRYKDNSRNFVVNYTLDNAITIYGTFNGEYKTISGYLINPNSIQGELKGEPKDWKITYDIHGNHNDNDTITIKPEVLTEHLLFADKTEGDYNFITYNGQKIYYDKNNSAILDNTYFMYQNYAKQYINDTTNNTRVLQYLKNRTYKGDLYSTSTIEHYYNAKKFSEEVADLTNGITQKNAVDENGNQIEFVYNTGDANIFKVSSDNDPLMDYSPFDENRRSVIRKSVESNLITAIANYNIYSTNTYEFSMPVLKETDWDKITNNVSVISFLQGIPIGHKYYNNYCVLTNNNNEETIKKENIYIITENASTKAREYHLAGCKHLLEESTDRIVGAYSNINFIRQTVRIAENDYMYFYPQNISNNKITSCYYCMVNATDTYTIEQIIKGRITEKDNETDTEKEKYNVSKDGEINKRFKKIREEYIKALAREKHELYQVEMDQINGTKPVNINEEREETEVTLSEVDIIMHKANTKKLTASVTPSGTKLVWNSTNTDVVTVDNQGNVKAIKEGRATIVVVAQDGSAASAKCNILVADDSITKIAIDPDNITINVGEQHEIKHKIEPYHATNKQLAWTSSNTEIATVNADGVVTGLKVGQVTITATAQDGTNVQAKCTVNVTQDIKINGLTLSKNNIIVEENEIYELEATIYPENATNKTLEWNSRNESIATVEASGTTGKVKGVALGTTMITVKATDGSDRTASCMVTVVPKKVKEITISPTDVKLYSGQTVNLTATVKPDNAFNKKVRWYSIYEDIAKVDENTGKVTALTVGETEIVAIADDGSGIRTTQYCKVTVLPRKVRVDRKEMTLYVESSRKLNATISPTTPPTGLVWVSSDEDIATVSKDGVVTAKSAGVVEIIAMAQDGSYDADSICTVTVIGSNWKITTNNSSAKGKVYYPASQSNPTVLEINSSTSMGIHVWLQCKQKVKVGDEVKITYMFTRTPTYNDYYLDFYVCGQGATGGYYRGATLETGYANQKRSYTVTVQSDSKDIIIDLIKSNTTSPEYTVKMYIYEILLNGKKIL